RDEARRVHRAAARRSRERRVGREARRPARARGARRRLPAIGGRRLKASRYPPSPMLRLVLPKGSLERATLQLFEDADLTVSRHSDVDYRADIDDPRVIDVTVLRPQEIPHYVAQG